MFGLTKDEWQDLVLSVNVHRKTRRLSPSRVAAHLRKALENTDEETLAHRLNFKDTTLLRKLAKLAELPVDVAATVDWGNRKGSLSMSAATEIQRLEDPAMIREAAIAAIEHDLSRAEARQVVQVHRRTQQSIRECVQSAINTRPKIERSELIIGSFLSTPSRASCARLGNDEAARLIQRYLAKTYPDIVAKALRINEDRFSLLLSAEDGAKLRALIRPDSVESLLTHIAEHLH
jgi:hypothetical protein